MGSFIPWLLAGVSQCGQSEIGLLHYSLHRAYNGFLKTGMLRPLETDCGSGSWIRQTTEMVGLCSILL